MMNGTSTPIKHHSNWNGNGVITPVVPYVNQSAPTPSYLGKRPHSAKSAIQHEREQLPIYSAKSKLLDYIIKYDSVIIVGETGSGKTTQLPQYIYQYYTTSNSKPYPYIIGVTQPRRIAATTVARRVAAEYGCELGSTVGYSIRFDDQCTDYTRIKYMTDGMLLRELQTDTILSRYGVIVLDEIHGRSVSTDILCAILKQVQHKRSNSNNKLKLVCMSATLAANEFSKFFNDAPIVYVQGRQYDVDILYTTQPCTDYVDSAVMTALQIHLTMPTGDILMFLTGSDEIEAARRILNDKSKLLPSSAMKYIVAPIYSTLSQESQNIVFEPTPHNTRKIIVATNIAETSVTIPNIVYVIDCGLVKQRHYYADTGVDRLIIVPVSQAEAFQRSGRAGRVKHGQCYRLMQEDEFMKLHSNIQPEIEHSDIASISLQLMCIDINPSQLQLLTKPSKNAYINAFKQLVALDAIDEHQHVTPLGKQLMQFPLSPPYAKMIVLSTTNKFTCSEEMLSLVAIMSTDTIFINHQQNNKSDTNTVAHNHRNEFSSIHGDHITYLQLYQAFAAIDTNKQKQWCIEHNIQYKSMIKTEQIRTQLLRICNKLSLPILSCRENIDHVRRCLLTGLCQHVARLQSNGVYQTLGSKPISCYLHPSSVLIDQRPKPDTVIFTELLETTKLYLRDVTTINPAWLTELLPKLYAGTESSFE